MGYASSSGVRSGNDGELLVLGGEVLSFFQGPSSLAGAAWCLSTGADLAFVFGGIAMSGQAQGTAQCFPLNESLQEDGSAEWQELPPLSVPRQVSSACGFSYGAAAVGG